MFTTFLQKYTTQQHKTKVKLFEHFHAEMTHIISLKSLFHTTLKVLSCHHWKWGDAFKGLLETELKVELIKSQRLVQIYTWISQPFLANEPLSHFTEAHSFVGSPFPLLHFSHGLIKIIVQGQRGKTL